MVAAGIERALRAQIVEDLFFGDEETEIAGDADLFELGVDSLGINRLVVFIERRFRVRIGDDEIVAENFRTLEALVTLVQKAR